MQTKYDELARLAEAAQKSGCGKMTISPEQYIGVHSDLVALAEALQALVSLKDMKDSSGGKPHILAAYNVGKSIAWADARAALDRLK